MTQPCKDKRVLVLDNHAANKGLTRETFAPFGIEVLAAADPRQALQVLSRERVDALVTDVQAYGMEFLSAARACSPDLPIIVMTGFTDGHLLTDTRLGSLATTVLAQPYEHEDLVLAVRHALRRQALSGATAALNADGQEKPPRVLLAEDDHSSGALLSAHLKKRGCDITCAEDGAAALALVSSEDYDILVTDVMMPSMDGIELTRRVKKLRPRLPIIVVSAMEDMQASLKALRAGAYCYVVKPVDMQELMLFMERAILAGGLERMLRDQNALLEKRTQALETALHELGEQSDLYATGRRMTVKQLSARIAHELKNPMNSISTSFYYVRSQMPQDTLAAKPKIAKHCETIETQIERAREIIDSMLDFARPETGQAADIHINDVLRESVRLTLPGEHRIDVRLELDPELPPIRASEAKLKLVFCNLISNATKAMKNEGILTVTTATDDDANVTIAFADIGPGLPGSIIHKIFDPFFTTDQEGGTGLGLSICREAVEQCGGTLVAGNAPHGGAVMTVTLPSPSGLPLGRAAGVAAEAGRPARHDAPAAGETTGLMQDSGNTARQGTELVGEVTAS